MAVVPREGPCLYAPVVKGPYVASITLCCAFLGFGVSAWHERPAAPPEFSGNSTAEDASRPWPSGAFADLEQAVEHGEAEGQPTLVYARIEAPHVRAFERLAAVDEELSRALGGFTVVRLDLDGAGSQPAMDLGLRTGPLFVLVERSPSGEISVTDAAEPLTGALFEPLGLRVELARLAEGRAPFEALRGAQENAPPPAAKETWALVRRLDAMGRHDRADSVFAEALAEERHPNGTLHRLALLRAAVKEHLPLEVMDGEGAIEAHLTVEADKLVLFHGYSTLASSFAARVQTLDDPETPGPVRAIGVDRWRRRMREATRLGYKACPPERLVPYMSLLLERYAEDQEDLDSMDKFLCRAIVKRLKREAPDSPWVRRAETLFGE